MGPLIHDAAVPESLPRPPVRSRERGGVFYTAAVWTPAAMVALVEHLAAGAEALAELPSGRLREVWNRALGTFLDPSSLARRSLETSLPRLSGLSPAGTAAALRTVVGGALGPATDALFEAARERRGGGLVTVILSSNLPALAVQPLLPALALGRPALVKSASSEPLFAPALIRALVDEEPRLADAVAAVTWPGGERALEGPVLERSETVIAYGDDSTLADLAGRFSGRLLGYGPKISLAALGDDVAPERVAAGLARDIALFDQRGCLSPHAVYTAGDAEALAEALARELTALRDDLPPGPAAAEDLAAVQQLRAEADLRGLYRPETEVETGTVVVEPSSTLRPSPGLRTARIHPVDDLDAVPAQLEAWRGSLQGAALAGGAWRLADALRALGVTRCSAPGALQAPDAAWHNGGRHPIELLTEPAPG